MNFQNIRLWVLVFSIAVLLIPIKGMYETFLQILELIERTPHLFSFAHRNFICLIHHR